MDMKEIQSLRGGGEPRFATILGFKDCRHGIRASFPMTDFNKSSDQCPDHLFQKTVGLDRETNQRLVV